MLYKHSPTEFEVKQDGDGRTLVGYASTFGGEPDAYGDIIEPGAFKKTIKDSGPPKTRIKLLYLHSQPLGMPKVLTEDKKGLYFEARVSQTALGDEVLELVRDGVVDKMSIGYRTIKERFDEKNSNIRYLEEVQLFEISAVPFPANENADIFGLKDGQPKFGQLALLDTVARALGMRFDAAKGLILPASSEVKSVVAFQDLPLLDRAREWDSDEAETRVRSWAEADDEPNARYRGAFVWYDAESEDLFDSYKLPIADVVEGELFAVPRAIFAAAAAIEGARGGVDIPEGDLDAVRAHLGRYYVKMRETFDDDTIVAPWDDEEASKSASKIVVSETVKTALETITNAGGKIAEASKQLSSLLEFKAEPEPSPDTPPEPSPSGDTPGSEEEEPGADESKALALIDEIRTMNAKLRNRTD